MSFLQRLVGIFFEPKKTFEDIHRRGSWLGIFALMSVLSIAATYAVFLRMDRETYMRKAMEMNPLSRMLSEEQMERQIEIIASQPPSVFERISALFVPVNLLVVYLILAAAYMLLFVLMGSGIPYKKSLAVTFWASAPAGILLMVLGILISYLKNPLDLELNPAANIASNLGWIVSDARAHPVWSSLLSSVDLFSVWTIALLSVGFAEVSEGKLTIGKAAGGVATLWVLWALAKAGFAAVF